GRGPRRGDPAHPGARRADPRPRGRPAPDGLDEPRSACGPRRGRARASRPPRAWADPLASQLAPAVRADALMGHAPTFASWERESGSRGEAHAFDYIEGCLKRHGLEVERREIEAYISLPLEARVVLDDGTVIEALTHSFSTTTAPEGLEAELVDG